MKTKHDILYIYVYLYAYIYIWNRVHVIDINIEDLLDTCLTINNCVFSSCIT